ncbi:MAG: NTP transferase domain-containing protein [Lachnospiraceae bacterium]|nr:NTP transferase domain-containing protein [Lachnospiraceae bacterium]
MNKLSFDLLRMLKEGQTFDASIFGSILVKEPSVILDAYKGLCNDGFVNDGAISDKGEECLKEHRIDNAIILAAGMSSRFVPFNYEKPKGLLEVKGEVLIERQIRQLREKGIEEIVIVVGHMKEQFAYLVDKYGVILVETDDYAVKNNHASVYAARDYLKNSIITSSDLFFSENIFQTYAYDAYYCTIFVAGKTAERGVETDEDDRIIDTFYGDKCYDIWVTLGYAFFSKRFSCNFLKIMETEFNRPETANKFWADIQDEHLEELFMYAKRVDSSVVHEFDSLEELREFDSKYLYDSGSAIMKKLCKLLAVPENGIIGIESLRKIKPSLFKFRCKGDTYICDVNPGEEEKLYYHGRTFYMSNNAMDDIRLYKMEKNLMLKGDTGVDINLELEKVYDLSKDFKEYHERALPLCAAENIISPFANLPLAFGFQERYIMNNTYSFNMDDNFIGCEKLFPYYQMISDSCERIFGAKYTDPRPFTGMQTLDMIAKTICKPGDKMMILDKEHGGHASVKPVVERLGVKVYSAPYDLDEYDLDYEAANKMIAEEGIGYVLLAPSDLIKPLDVEKIDTTNCVLLWDCSQLMGLIAAGLCPNPLKTMKNIVMFGGTHKTFPGPASGLIMTNEKYLHDMMEKNINPKYLRNSQMHQKICLLFSLLEFEKYGDKYMSHMVHCSNYLGQKLRDYGFDIADWHGQISSTHQIFIRCSKEEMDLMYDNAYKCEITLNKKHKELFLGYGIRLGTQEIARYDWNDKALDKVAYCVKELANPGINVEEILGIVHSLPAKVVHYTFPEDVYEKFDRLMGR